MTGSILSRRKGMRGDTASQVEEDGCVTGLGEHVVYDYARGGFRPLNHETGSAAASIQQCGWVDDAEPHGTDKKKKKKKQASRKPVMRLSEQVWTEQHRCYDCWTSCDRVTLVDRCVGDGVNGVHGGGSCMKALGHMLFLNSDPEAYRDFLMWNDPVDDAKAMHGTLLPLWDVPCRLEGDQDMHIMAMSFDPHDDDVFAVGLGSSEYGQSIGGRVSVYALFDLHRPQYTIALPSGVTSLSFGLHGWIVVGCEDGGVVVFHRHASSCMGALVDREPYTMHACRLDQHHLFPVWHVSFQDQKDESIVIQSVSQDGEEATWSCGHDGMVCRFKTTRRLLETHGRDFVAVSCADASKDGEVTVYGTLTGHLMSCTCTSATHHIAPVHSVSINPFESQYCMSASLDWTVSIRDSNTLETKLEIDIGQPVTDAQWSPRASTILAAITESGDALVYDLSVSKDVPLCHQRISGKDSLTKIAFHRHHPLVFIGTSGGRMVCLKLSPNLQCRKQADDVVDFAFLDEDREDSVRGVQRPILPIEEQIDVLHDTLKHPY